MLEAHTVDAWTRPSSRAGRVFADAVMLGGLAAPLFLWLAGVGVALAAERAASRAGRRGAGVEAVFRRGLEIFILAFLFRLQSFVVTPGGPAVMLFRVDILNVMGLAMAAAALLWRVHGTRALVVSVYAAAAAAVGMLTPLVRAWPSVDGLPVWIQWHLRPAGEYTTFTLFPWAGFLFAGAACGVVLAGARDRAQEDRAHRWLFGAGALVAAGGCWLAGRPSLYAQSAFWTSSPTYFMIRIGLLTMGLAACYVVERALSAGEGRGGALARFGRSSLFVYWVHVELVYGYASWALHRRLPLWGVGVGCSLLAVLMYGAVTARDRLMAAWREHRALVRPLITQNRFV